MSTPGTTFRWNTPGQVAAAATVLPALGIITVALRFRVRALQKAKLGVDDWLILPALLLVVGMGISLLVGVSHRAIGYPTPPDPRIEPGNPISDLLQSTPKEVLVQKVEFVFTTFLIAAYGFIKLSIILYYRRLFSTGQNRGFDMATKASAVIVVLWTLVFFCLQVFNCGTHFSKNWGPLVALTSCVEGKKRDLALFVSDLVTDLFVIALPFPIIAKLNLPLSRRLFIIGNFMLGALSIAASATRLVFTIQFNVSPFYNSVDIDEALTTLLYWSMLEAGIGLIASSLPSLHFLCRKSSWKAVGHRVRSIMSITQRAPFSAISTTGSAASMSTVKEEPRGVESFATHGGNTDMPLGRLGQIYVRKDLVQTDRMV